METLAFILSTLGFISVTSASLIKGKRMKLILFLVCCANVLYATSYVLQGKGINGAASCYLGGLLAIVNYLFDAKGKPVPKWLAGVYAAAFIAVNVIFGTEVLPTVIAIAATMCFVASIGMPNGAKYRFWTAVNLLLWITFDVVTNSRSTLVAHGLQLTGNVIGMIIHDRKAKAVEATK